MSRFSKYLTHCTKCGRSTTKQHAAANEGLCKSCVSGVAEPEDPVRRNERIIDSGWHNYALEEGHYDHPDY